MKFSYSAKTILITAIVLGSGAFSGPAAAESILNHLLPSVFGPPDEGPRPEDTLQAPFGKDAPVQQGGSVQQNDLMKMYEQRTGGNKTDVLTNAHRSSEQVGQWATGVVTQALSIDPLNYKPGDVQAFFTPYAFQEYNTYLSSNQTVETLKGNAMKLNTFSEDRPVLIQEGLLDTAYRWVFRVPVVLTYIDRNAKTMKGKTPPKQQTQRVTINIQITRVSTKENFEGLKIERWSVSRG